MNLFRDFFEGVAAGFASAAPDQEPANPAGAAVEMCCRQLGWSIDERPSANEVGLYFKGDSLVRRRKVMIGFGDAGIYAAFRVCSAVWIPAREVPVAALGYLLERNAKPFVAWQILIGDDEEAGFSLNYVAVAAGLRPDIFKLVCETMVKEAYLFDAKMDEAGVLR
jgi:hypothetical protein